MNIHFEILSASKDLRGLLTTEGFQLLHDEGDQFVANNVLILDQQTARSRLFEMGVLTSPRLRIEFGPYVSSSAKAAKLRLSS